MIYLTKAAVFRFWSTTIPEMRRLNKYLHIDRPQSVKLELGCEIGFVGDDGEIEEPPVKDLNPGWLIRLAMVVRTKRQLVAAPILQFFYCSDVLYCDDGDDGDCLFRSEIDHLMMQTL